MIPLLNHSLEKIGTPIQSYCLRPAHAQNHFHPATPHHKPHRDNAPTTVAISVIFSDSDRRAIQQWAQATPASGLPPGLAKRGTLPPGLQKKLSYFPNDLPADPGFLKRLSVLNKIDLGIDAEVLTPGHIQVSAPCT